MPARTAPVTTVEEIGTGITNPWRVTQERDGVVNDNPPLWDDERKDGSRQIPFSTAVSAGGNVALKVTLVNRKGQPYGEAFPNVVTTLGDDC